MSAAVWDPAGLSLVPQPRHLTLVPTRTTVGGRAGLRLTRWGRLAITLTLLVVVLSVAATAVVRVGALGSSAGATSIQSIQTVRPGQTLSEIAARELPAMTVREGVARILLANNLSSSEIHAGQTLAIPAG